MKLFRILFRIYLEYDWTKNLIFRVQISPQSNNIQISGISAITLELDHQKSWFLCWNYSIDHLYLLPTFFWFYFNTKVKGFAQLGYYDSPSNVSTAIGTPADDNLFDFEPANTPPPQEESPNQSRVSFTLKHEIFSMLDS
jgi:hypothetical protein